jgi:hypothetical protein
VKLLKGFYNISEFFLADNIVAAKPAPQHSILPRVQGIQNILTNTPVVPHTIAPALPAARANQQCDGGLYENQ